MSTIYKHTNIINGMSYIGRTNYDVTKRFNRHISSAKNGSNFDFHKAIRKYGSDNFETVILEECDKTIVCEREEYWIKYYNTFNDGYNMNNGGSNGMVTKESKDKFRNTINRINDNSSTIAKDRYKKRNETLLKEDINALKVIGKKSSETQKENGKNKGKNNPNFNSRKIFVFDFFGNKVDEFLHIDMKSKKYPQRAVLTSIRSKTPIYLHNYTSDNYNFVGYHFCYEDELFFKTLSKRAKNNYIKLKSLKLSEI